MNEIPSVLMLVCAILLMAILGSTTVLLRSISLVAYYACSITVTVMVSGATAILNGLLLATGILLMLWLTQEGLYRNYNYHDRPPRKNTKKSKDVHDNR